MALFCGNRTNITHVDLFRSSSRDQPSSDPLQSSAVRLRFTIFNCHHDERCDVIVHSSTTENKLYHIICMLSPATPIWPGRPVKPRSPVAPATNNTFCANKTL